MRLPSGATAVRQHRDSVPPGRPAVHRGVDGRRHLFGGLAQRRVVEMDVAVGRARPAMPEQAFRDMQVFAVHHRVRGVRMAQLK